MDLQEPHSIYKGASEADEPIVVHDGVGSELKQPIRFKLKKPDGPDGVERDQTNDAANHMRYAASLNLPQLVQSPRPRLGRAVIVGGGPDIKDHLEGIRSLSSDPNNAIFALNWSHTWLINNGIIPRGCVFFEIDAEPDSVLDALHPDVTYFICSHCHEKTFDALKGRKCVLWHSPPNSDAERKVGEELFKGSSCCGGGITTFTRTITVAMHLGYRHFDLFGCGQSFPDDGRTHVDGYETVMDATTDGMYIYAKSERTGQLRRFKSLGYLALQVEEFKAYCQYNHQFFSMRVHGDSLLRFVHEEMYPDQYSTHITYGK